MGIRNGARATLVAHVVIWDEKGEHLCRGHLTKQFFKLRDELAYGTGCITIINAKVQQIKGPVLTVDENAKTLVHQQTTMSSFKKVSETCGGLGALGLGAVHSGFCVTTINDIQSSFCSVLQTDGSHHVVQGDICKMPTIVQLHENGKGSSILAFGFSCQPFSSLGDNRQGQDERSATLTYGLYAAYLLQMKIVILECVTNALQSKFVKVGIQHYLNHTDAFRSDEVLELSDLWPSCRRRWWCALSHPSIGKISLSPLPKLQQTPTMSDLMPKFMDVTSEELEQLTLTDHEQSMFLSLSGGSHHQVLDIHSTLQTALHSWGNQCIKCRCGCNREFSFQRLKAEGIHGALIYMNNCFPGKSLRHMCAREMAIFNGFPKSQGWQGDQRMLTAGVGQLASPIQCAWIFGLVHQHLKAIKFVPHDELTPKSSVASVCFATIDLQQQWMGSTTTIEMDMFRESITDLLKETKPDNPLPLSLWSLNKQFDHFQDEGIQTGLNVESISPSNVVETKVPVSPKELKPGKGKSMESSPGFTQAIASHIVAIEQSVVGKAPPEVIDPKTGGIVAFASSPTKKGKRRAIDAFGEIESQVCSQTTTPQVTTSSAAVVESSLDSQLYKQVGPVDLDENIAIIYDIGNRQAFPIKVSKSTTFRNLIQAENELQGEPRVL